MYQFIPGAPHFGVLGHLGHPQKHVIFFLYRHPWEPGQADAFGCLVVDLASPARRSDREDQLQGGPARGAPHRSRDEHAAGTAGRASLPLAEGITLV